MSEPKDTQANQHFENLRNSINDYAEQATECQEGTNHNSYYPRSKRANDRYEPISINRESLADKGNDNA